MSAADEAVRRALQQLGDPYEWGAEGPDTFDCSGLVQYSYGLAGISTPRTADEQMRWAQRVDEPARGDLVFWTRGGRAYHVGIYVGDGRVVDAPSRGRPVQVRPIWGTPTYGRVPGSGTSLPGKIRDTIGDVLQGPADAVDDLSTRLLGGARDVVTRGLVLAAGIGISVAGLYVLTAGAGRQVIRSTLQEVT